MKLESVDYWEYRVTMEEMLHEQTKQKLVQEKFQNSELKIDLERMKALGLRQALNAQVDKAKKFEADYKEHVLKLEQKLGISLKNVAINPVSFEITDLSEPKVSKNENEPGKEN